jgi:hypothetical protein
MAAKIITFLSIFGINIAVGVAIIFLLMLGLNGFTERDANYAFAIFIIGGLVVSVLTATAGIFLVRLLTGKQWNAVLAVLLSIVACTALGFVLKIGIFFIAIFVAGFVRSSR